MRVIPSWSSAFGVSSTLFESLSDFESSFELCFEGMRAWVIIATQILSAEFPCFHVVGASSIFSVDYRAGRDQIEKLSRMR